MEKTLFAEYESVTGLRSRLNIPRAESRQIIHIHKTDGISLDMTVETGGQPNE